MTKGVIKENNSYNILEFGSGESSIKIAELFNNIDNFIYYTYEPDNSYIQTHDKIKTILYDENNIQNLNLEDNIDTNILLCVVITISIKPYEFYK